MRTHWLIVISTIAACGDNLGGSQDVCLVCAANAACDPTAAAPCACPAGFTGDATSDGTGCADIDECTALTDNCVAGAATCTNTFGGFTCACNAGFTGDGVTTGAGCVDVDECAAHTDNCIPLTATCTNTIGAFSCTCNPGFTGDGTMAGTGCTCHG
jgi:hypothetical protein